MERLWCTGLLRSVSRIPTQRLGTIVSEIVATSSMCLHRYIQILGLCLRLGLVLDLIFQRRCWANVSTVAGFPLAFAMSPLANQTKNWRNGICIFSPIWRNQINDNSNPMAKHSHCFHDTFRTITISVKSPSALLSASRNHLPRRCPDRLHSA